MSFLKRIANYSDINTIENSSACNIKLDIIY